MEKKFDDAEILKITRDYIEQAKYIKKITYSDLARYAISLGYVDAKEWHFRRRDEIKQRVKNFNNGRSNTNVQVADDGEIKYFKLDVDNLVEKHFNNKSQLKKLLKIFKEAYDKAFNELKKLNNELISKGEKIKELENAYSKLNSKNINLRLENQKMKEINQELKENKRNLCVLNALKYVLENKNVEVTNEGEIAQLLTSFGVPFNKSSINLAQELENTIKELELESETIYINTDNVHKNTEVITNDNVIPLNNRKKSTKKVAKKPDYLKE